MKDIRIKIDDLVHETIKAEAAAASSFPATIVKDIVESHYKKNLGGILINFSPEHMDVIARECKKNNVGMDEYIGKMLDKFLPKDNMFVVAFNVPKTLRQTQITDWFSSRVSKVVDTIKDKLKP